MNNPGQEQKRYEVIVQEDPETGDLLIPIPQILLDQLGWKPGDEAEFGKTDEGSFFLKKINK